MPHAIRAALVVCLCLAGPASASTLLFSFSGTIDAGVKDTDNFLDDSVVADVAVTGTYEVDLATADTHTPFTVGLAHLSFGLGNYTFDASQDPHSITFINNTGPPISPVDIWQSLPIKISDLGPSGTNTSGNFAGYAARIEFFDGTASQLDGTETAPFVPDVLGDWNIKRLVLESHKDNGDGTTSFDDRVQVQVNFDSWSVQVVPEPSSVALLALGLVSLALRARVR